MSVVWSPPIAFTVLIFVVINTEDYEVEARPKDVIPVPGWFNSVEGFVLPNLKKFRPSDIARLQAKHILNVVSDEYSKTKKKKKKKRKKLVNDISNSLQNEKLERFEVVKKKKKKKAKGKMVFLKSRVKDKDNTSALSGSKEKVKKKPMDIIVHIKMNNN